MTVTAKQWILKMQDGSDSAASCISKSRFTHTMILSHAEMTHPVQVQFIRTAGLYAKMRQERPGKPDPLPKLQRDLMSSLGTSDERMPLTLRYKVFMMMAKAPKPV